MGLFGCSHEWHEVRREIHGPDKDIEEVTYRGASQRVMAEKVTLGYTVLELECEKCHDVGIRTLIGLRKKPDAA